MNNKIIEVSNMLNDCIKQGKLIELYVKTSYCTYQKRGNINGSILETDSITIDCTSEDKVEQLDVLVFNLDEIQEIYIEESTIKICFPNQVQIYLTTNDLFF